MRVIIAAALLCGSVASQLTDGLAFGRQQGQAVPMRDAADEIVYADIALPPPAAGGGGGGGDGGGGGGGGGGGSSSKKKPASGARAAVVITVTKDPDPGKRGYIDGAGVLAHSVRRVMSAKWPTDMVAIVMPAVTKSRKALEYFGYRVVEADVKVKSSEIKGEELRNTIDKSGCCGMDELIKLEAFRLVEYERVMILDADSLLLQNVDELLESAKDAVFTMDHGLGGNCINGGFLVSVPAEATYQALYGQVRLGNFLPGAAWGGKNIGWCYGGQTYQGLIPYYFKWLHKGGKSWEAVDSLVYNNMVTATNDAKEPQKDTPLSKIKTTHFTVCQKPWLCFWNTCCTLCHTLYDEWWKIRNEVSHSATSATMTPP
jgi:hypothetical protein